MSEQHYCKDCDYKTTKMSSWNRHCKSIRHMKNIGEYDPNEKKEFECLQCGSEYINYSNLLDHINKKKHWKVYLEKSMEYEKENKKLNKKINKIEKTSIVDKTKLEENKKLIKEIKKSKGIITKKTNNNNTYSINIK